MASILLKNVKIISPGTSYHKKKLDVFIKSGKIQEIGKNIEVSPVTEEWSEEGLCVSPGWLDLGVNITDPGLEYKETIEETLDSAAKGGYTAVAPFSTDKPVIQSKSELEYLAMKSFSHLVNLFPIAAFTKDMEGEEMTEMYDLTEYGSVAFSDGLHSIQNAGVLLRGLQYAKPLEKLLIHHPSESSLVGDATVNEGVPATLLGMKGVPDIAEHIAIQRDLNVLSYTQSALLIHAISTAGSVKLLKEGKKKNENLFSSVAVSNIYFQDEVLKDYETSYKLLPVIGSKADKKGLIKGIKDGVIDVLASNHQPQDSESKELEFLYADYGTTSLQTSFGAAWKVLSEHIDIQKWVELVSLNPRKILGVEIPKIKEGERAELTVFSPNKKWTFEKKDIFSRAKNSAFIGEELKGKVYGVISNGKSLKND